MSTIIFFRERADRPETKPLAVMRAKKAEVEEKKEGDLPRE
ncbi:hypothetical protein [[Eubacterium] cellulosolvens]